MQFDATEYRARRNRLADQLSEWGVEMAIVTTPSDLRYFTGFPGRGPLGPNPFAEGPEGALLRTAEAEVLCLPDGDLAAVPEESALPTAAFTTFLDLRPLDDQRRLAEQVLETIGVLGSRPSRVGVQVNSAPVSLWEELGKGLPGSELNDLGTRVRRLRMVKSEKEIEVMRRAAAICDRAQATVEETAKPGAREIDVLHAVADEMRPDIGDVAFIHEITCGARSGTIGNLANETTIQGGDLVLSDIAPPVDGYWGDSAGTRVAGAEPDERQTKMLEIVREALKRGTEAVRPGITAGELDATMRGFVGESEFPAYHNSGGHGIGVDYHEPPRLVPEDQTPLEAGMVLAMEPGIYLPEFGGVRLEHLALVTADGCEVLSGHLQHVS